MQIIQSIRDKGAAVVIIVIALSLFSFILMDAQQGGSKLFGSLTNDVGEINGEKIELNEFTKRVTEAEDMQAQRTGQRPSGTQTYDIREQTWNQVVAEKIFYTEASKLGIEFTANELSSILLSNDPSNPFLQEQSLKDSATGKLDISKAKQALNNIKKLKGEQRDNFNAQVVNSLRLSNTVAKYSALLSASAYYPTWQQKKESADNVAFANISFVTVPYSDISDSTVKVTDEEVKVYVGKHKEQFKQEAGRNISYIAFSQLPSLEDSQMVYNTLAELKAPFEADSNTKSFLSKNLSTVDFNDDYQPKSKLNNSNADTLTKLSVGNVFGPFVDKQSYVLAKMIGSKRLLLFLIETKINFPATI
jgi:peptidyl-prolyl cis-trans isomerase D